MTTTSDPDVAGYASSTSVTAGGAISFHLSARIPGPRALTVARVGSGPTRAIDVDVPFQGVKPGCERQWEGCCWDPTWSFTVAEDWPSGLYRLLNPAAAPEARGVLAFAVTPEAGDRGRTSKIVLAVDFITPQVYNSFGGKSLYDFNSGGKRASMVSFDRPNRPGDWQDPASNERYEAALIRWLERQEKAVEYCSLVDLHTDPELLWAYDCLVIAGHAEYWTKEIRDRVDAFVSSGGNVVVLSGNTCYRQVRLEADARRVVFHKFPAADPVLDRTRVTATYAQPPLNRPPNASLGAGFTAGAEFRRGEPESYTLQFLDHWALAGLPSLPGPFMGYETDAAEYLMEQGRDRSYARATGTDGTPHTYTILGYADLRGWRKPGFATMGLLQRAGTVFHGGSIEWSESLDTNPGLAKITLNVLDRLGTRRSPEWEDVGQAEWVTAMAALDGRLYAATSHDRLWRRYPVGGNADWTELGGTGGRLVALASASGVLFALTGGGEIRLGTVAGSSVTWSAYGTAPAGARTLAAVGEVLYACDANDALHSLSLRAPAEWQRVMTPQEAPLPPLPGVTSLTCCDDVIFARTSDGRLHRTNQDIIWESTGWTNLFPAGDVRAMAVVDRLLFAAVGDYRLHRLDLNGLDTPAPVSEAAPVAIRIDNVEFAATANVA